MKRLGLVALAGAMALLLSSCFTLQSFSIQDSSLKPGQLTKVVLTVRPWSTSKTGLSKMYQWVLVGVNNTSDLAVQNAKWNGNKTFGPVQQMPVSSAIATSIGTQCDGNGFTFGSITGVTWKGFISLNPIPDKQLVDKVATITVGLKAKATAGHQDQVRIFVLTGGRLDGSNHDGIVDPTDSFACSGNANSVVFIK
ncbi:MAG TPA: hypothetical protein VK646_01265 [Actinomycetota bacterium]|nr:hypothetical protein [Actinomycetota bacterium]